MTIEQVYKDYIGQLKNIYNAREADQITDWVLESIAGIKKTDRRINKDAQLGSLIIQQLSYKLQQLLEHRPVQYVLQESWFYKMKFFVNEHVLIPRPETEELVEWVATESKGKDTRLRLLDIGTGSGCIAIALKKELATATVTGIDISEDALSVARKNALTLDTKTEFMQLDFLDENEWARLPLVDIIVSNPPYIPEKEKIQIDKNVIQYEPHIALFTSDTDPFIFYKKIVLYAERYLHKQGVIYVEVHENYAGEVRDLFIQQQLKSTIRKDIYGKNRMIKAHW